MTTSLLFGMSTVGYIFCRKSEQVIYLGFGNSFSRYLYHSISDSILGNNSSTSLLRLFIASQTASLFLNKSALCITSTSCAISVLVT